MSMNVKKHEYKINDSGRSSRVYIVLLPVIKKEKTIWIYLQWSTILYHDLSKIFKWTY